MDNIYSKLLEYEPLFECEFIATGSGYFFYTLEPRLLVSFGINMKDRTPEKLKEFWGELTKQVGGKFDCLLWSANTRAIKWLEKVGMTVEEEVEYEGEKITHLNYNICH